ncbi:hypothetical protein [Streptomyces cinerochromogenes]|uniref:hypothetical protein n=1 Tax=Streptomyces cinerochromogenes TaxID=66422 RepID=UPI00166FF6D9|nr:hypothetical protein [Streptomyces cinerochromogenes]GGS55100.1 hypothetical protein GCM10010206_16050 [Streptomyces cinerochromogenes]
MGRRVEKSGYTAELTDDLEVVYRNPQGRKLKKFPDAIAGAPGLGTLLGARTQLRRHREACRLQAGEWASGGVRVPRALADADPLWREALEAESVELTDELGGGGLWARTYAGFDGRTLTQVLPEQLIPYRDRLMRGQQWEPDGCFSTGIPDTSDGALPFPERVIAAHPGLEELATGKLLLLQERTLHWSFAFKTDVDGALRDLEESAPALLITLLDDMADLALRQGEQTTAAAWFGRARTVERVQARKADKEWLLGRYLTYAEGKALSATVLRAWARELAVKGEATEADVARFRQVVVRRVEASSEVYPQLAVDVRKLAKAAGLEPERELATLLGEIFAVGGVSLSDDKFWTDCLKGRAMDLLGSHAPEAARQVLRLRPRRFGESPRVWRELLERTGALALLTGETPGLPVGEAAAWLSACVLSNSDRNGPWTVVYEIAERIAPKLAADGVPVEFRYRRIGEHGNGTTPLDLIDLLLEHGAPVADPPELLGPSQLYSIQLSHRPKLEHLQADERFARELRARVRTDLEMTIRDLGANDWYQPHQTKGWQRIPELFDNPIGHEEIRAWFGRERAKLRAGVDFGELVLLLGRLVHAGVAVDLLLKDAEAAAEFAAVDVVPLLMAELPDTVSRAQAEELLGRLRPDYVERDGVRGPNRGPILEALPQLGEPTGSRAARSLVMAVNCRAGLERLVGCLTPGEGDVPPGADAGSQEPEDRVSRQMMALAKDGTAVWGGDLGQATTTFDRMPRDGRFRHTHACAAALALCTVSSLPSGSAARSLMQYAAHPFVTGEPGHWRIVHCEVPEDRTDINAPLPGTVFRTDTSVAYVLTSRGRDPRRTLWEYSPDGSFTEEGPLAPAGVKVTRAHVLKPVRPGGWFTRFAELYRKHGAAPARPELARAFAERLGLSQAEATVLLIAHVPCAPHQLDDEKGYLSGHYSADLEAWKIRHKEAEQAVAALTDALGPRFITALYDRLLPDDPEQLWATGPDVDRAAEWWLEELGSPLPVPSALLPLATKETLPPQGEAATARQSHGDDGSWWPHLRLPALLGRLAGGADCLAPHRAGLAGEPHLLALPRIAAWLAYRTPAGDPSRLAAGAAISRLREELSSAPGPLTLFSLQSNYLMGAPPSTEALTAHPAVTEVADAVYDVRHLRVDPAALKGPDDPLLDALDTYLDSVLPSQWLPSPSGLPAVADLRLLLSDDFAALGAHLLTDGERPPGWEQDPSRSVPHLVEDCAETFGLGRDAASLYLMLLALPDPSDRNVKAWTGWKPSRFKKAEAELHASGRVLRALRSRAGRSLFLPGAWQERKPPRLPIEASKLGLLPLSREHRSTSHLPAVPSAPLPLLFTRAWEGVAP